MQYTFSKIRCSQKAIHLDTVGCNIQKRVTLIMIHYLRMCKKLHRLPAIRSEANTFASAQYLVLWVQSLKCTLHRINSYTKEKTIPSYFQA